MSDYIIVYYLLILIYTFIIIICDALSDKAKKVISSVFLFIFSFVISMRPLDSPDTRAYEYAFEHSKYLVRLINPNHLFVKIYAMEPGYILIMFILKKIISFRIFLFFSALFILGLSTHYLYCISEMLSKETKLSKLFIDYTFVIIFGGYYAGAAMRAGIIMSLGIMAFYMILKKKYILGLLIVIGSCLIQRSAIVFAFIFLVYMFLQNINKRLVSSCIFLFSVGAILNYKLQIINLNYIMTRILENTPISSYSKYLINTKGSMGELVVITFVFIFLVVVFTEGYERLYPILAMIPLIYLVFPMITSSKRLTDMFLVFIVPIVATNLSKFRIMNYAYKIKLSFLLLFVNLFVLMIGNCRLFLY